MTNPSGLKGRKIIIFVRHGESKKNVIRVFSSELGKYPLTRKGRKQAETIARELCKLRRIGKLYASPVLRAQETARIISIKIGVKPATSGLLWERNAGKYECLRYRDGEEDEILNDQIKRSYPDWESWTNMIKRMARFSRLSRSGIITIAVTHGDPIKATLGYLLKKKESELPDLDKIGIFPGTMTVIDFGRKGKNAIVAIGVIKLPEEFRR